MSLELHSPDSLSSPDSRPDVAPDPLPDDARDPHVGPGLLGLTVLLVDDAPHVVDPLAAILEVDGATVLRAASAREAFPSIDAGLPHVVVTDLAMPDIDGFALLDYVRRTPEPPRVVAVTGYGSAADAVRVIARGFDGYLIKPVELMTFLAEVRRVAGRA